MSHTRKAQIRQTKTPSPINLIQIQSPSDKSTKVDSGFRPFISDSLCSLWRWKTAYKSLSCWITGAMQSHIHGRIFPFSMQSYCGSDVLPMGGESECYSGTLALCSLRFTIGFRGISDCWAKNTGQDLFPMCAITCAQAHTFGDLMDLSDSFMSSSDQPSSPHKCEISAPVTELQPMTKPSHYL